MGTGTYVYICYCFVLLPLGPDLFPYNFYIGDNSYFLLGATPME